MKKIIFLGLISLFFTGWVFALPMPAPVQERIREINQINQRIDQKVTETTQRITQIAQEVEIKNEIVEGLKQDIQKINSKIQEEKTAERTIEEKRREQEVVEQRIITLEKDATAFHGADLRIIQREIEKVGITITPEEIQAGMRGIRQDARVVLNETKEKKVELEREIEEATQKRERAKDELREIKGRVQERVTEAQIKIETMPLIERMEREVRDEKEVQLTKIAEIKIDSDGDGLTDEEEVRLGTDPFNPDSDGDGFLDGIEVRHGFNPLSLRKEAEVIHQDPRDVTPREVETYIVKEVRVILLPDGRRGLEVSGRGLPNSYVTLFIFSEPIIVSVRVDENGRWSYLFEDPEDGKHEIFVAVTNNQGAIEARSLVFPIVLAGENVAVLPHVAKIAALPLEEIKTTYLILTISIIVIGLIASLYLIKKFSRKKEGLSF